MKKRGIKLAYVNVKELPEGGFKDFDHHWFKAFCDVALNPNQRRECCLCVCVYSFYSLNHEQGFY